MSYTVFYMLRGFSCKKLLSPFYVFWIEMMYFLSTLIIFASGGSAEEFSDFESLPSTARSASSRPQAAGPTRAIARTQQSERVRANVNRHRITQARTSQVWHEAWSFVLACFLTSTTPLQGWTPQKCRDAPWITRGWDLWLTKLCIRVTYFIPTDSRNVSMCC